jgi:hypothetical protein
LGSHSRPASGCYTRTVDANSLLASLLVSSIGVGLFLYGKKQSRLPQLVVGIIMVGYSYFVSDVLLMFAIAAVLIGLLFLALKLGM